MGAREYLILIAMCTIWGFHFVVVKFVVAEIPPIFYAAIRMTLAAVLTAAFLRWRRGQMAWIFAAGLCFGVFNYAFMFSGLKYAPASVSAVTIELYVPFATLLSVIFLGEKVGWRRMLGITLAFSGVAVIALGEEVQSAGDKVGLGVTLIACGAMCEAVGAILVKRLTGFKPLELLSWFVLIGALMLWPLTFILERDHGAAFAGADKGLLAGAVLYSAIGASIFGHSAYYWLLQRLPVSQVAASTLLTTLIAVAAGIVILGEPFGPAFFIGGAMTLAGVGVVLARTPEKKAAKVTSG